MRPEVEDLIDAVLDEADSIDDLVEIMAEQREAMKVGDAAALDELMKEMREVVFDLQTQSASRDEGAKRLAARLECEPRVSSLSAHMGEDERALFGGAADRLGRSIFALKSEMMILSGLVDQNERYTSMLLSEWRRLVGDAVQPGATDFRG